MHKCGAATGDTFGSLWWISLDPKFSEGPFLWPENRHCDQCSCPLLEARHSWWDWNVFPNMHRYPVIWDDLQAFAFRGSTQWVHVVLDFQLLCPLTNALLYMLSNSFPYGKYGNRMITIDQPSNFVVINVHTKPYQCENLKQTKFPQLQKWQKWLKKHWETLPTWLEAWIETFKFRILLYSFHIFMANQPDTHQKMINSLLVNVDNPVPKD